MAQAASAAEMPEPSDGTDESTISRSHFVIDHVKRGGPKGLLSIVGGKLTTYRALARLAVPAIAKHVAPSGAPTAASDAWTPRDGTVRDGDPLALYGPRAAEVRALIAADASLGAPICEHNPELLAQVAYAVQREQALTLADVLLRRLPAGWSRCHALDGAGRAAAVMARDLGWDAARTAAEVAVYARELRDTLVPVDAIG